jgi:hypothetical protein
MVFEYPSIDLILQLSSYGSIEVNRTFTQFLRRYHPCLLRFFRVLSVRVLDIYRSAISDDKIIRMIISIIRMIDPVIGFAKAGFFVRLPLAFGKELSVKSRPANHKSIFVFVHSTRFHQFPS